MYTDGINWDPDDEFIIADCHSPTREEHRPCSSSLAWPGSWGLLAGHGRA